MKIIFIIVVTILFLFCLIIYVAFSRLLKEQFNMTENYVMKKIKDNLINYSSIENNDLQCIKNRK